LASRLWNEVNHAWIDQAFTQTCRLEAKTFSHEREQIAFVGEAECDQRFTEFAARRRLFSTELALAYRADDTFLYRAFAQWSTRRMMLT
jgi:hypothetical protein